MTTDRSFPRFTLIVPLFISFGREIFQKQVRLESKNVSGGGLAFETSRKVPVDADTRVLVSGLGDLPPEARIEGRVVY
ncbi:MAG: PilZ domain-containing protein, partial [Vicinamibacteria bacterium]